jgi:hypothetical protein
MRFIPCASSHATLPVGLAAVAAVAAVAMVAAVAVVAAGVAVAAAGPPSVVCRGGLPCGGRLMAE